jgi:hypothetical protein
MGIFSSSSAYNSADLALDFSISITNFAKFSSHSCYNFKIYSSSLSYSALKSSSMSYNNLIKSVAGSPTLI